MTATEKSLTYIVSEEAITGSELQELVVNKVAEDILWVFEAHDVRFFDVWMIMQKVKWSCDMYQDRSMSKMAGMLDEFDGNVDKQIREIRVSHLKKFLNS